MSTVIGPSNLELAVFVIFSRSEPLSPSRTLVGNDERITPDIGEAGSCAGVGVLDPDDPLLPDDPVEPLLPEDPDDEDDEPVPTSRSTTAAALGVPSPVAVS